MLGEPLRRQVSLAYLLCRLLDTFEDDPALPPSEKKAALEALCTALESGTDPGSLEAYIPQLRSPEAELELVGLAPALFRSLRALPEPVWCAVAGRAAEMGRGMLALVDDPEIRTPADLEKYCYYVAGTVGHMLTAVFTGAVRVSARRRAVLEATAENFGKCLQYVNIIKDSGPDFREGRRFLPTELITAGGCPVEDFFAGRVPEAAARVYAQLFARAHELAGDARRYILALPWRAFRYRRFCILPLLLADKTLALCTRLGGGLAVMSESPKIGRGQVKRSVVASIPAAGSNLVFRLLQSKQSPGGRSK